MGTKKSPGPFILVILLLAGVVVVVVYSGAGARMMGMGSMGRHHQGMMGGLPADYINERNPYPAPKPFYKTAKGSIR